MKIQQISEDDLMNDFLNKIINVSTDIINDIGVGFNEVVYKNAFEIELRLLKINYSSEVIIPVYYKGFPVGHGRADIIIFDNENIPDIIIEFKAINNLNGKEKYQLQKYLNGYEIKNGIIINFNQRHGNIEYEVV